MFNDALANDACAELVRHATVIHSPGSYYDGFGNPIVFYSPQHIVSSSYSVTLADTIVEMVVPYTTASLPTAVGNAGKEYSIINVTTGSIMIQASGSQTIGNSSITNDTYLLVRPGDAPRIVSNNTNWRLI